MYYYLIPLVIVGLATVYRRMMHPLYHWQRVGVKQGKPTVITGHNWGTFIHNESFAEFVKTKIYGLFPDERYMGTYQFTKPFLILRDPEIIKQVTVKDFEYFTDHMNPLQEGSDEPFWSSNLFLLKGEIWKEMRATLSPAFTSSKMKSMFAFMSKCSSDFVGYFDEERTGTITLELKDTFTRYTNDIIATCAFGIECNSLKDRDNEFYAMGKETTAFGSLSKNLKFMLMMLFPKLARIFGMTMFSSKVYEFFTALISDTVKYREENSVIRPDMIHLLMQARKGDLKYEEKQESSKETGYATVEESSIGIAREGGVKREITLLDMTAHALLFFFAGFETVSILMCFMAHELAVNQDVQRKLIDEVQGMFEACGGKLSYDALSKMKYLDMVIAETLRKYPPTPLTERLCTKDYEIKPEKPSEVVVHVKKGDTVWIPTYAIQNDPKYYSEPDRFNPERFNDVNKADIKPYTYLPFGAGPRNCIGSRFALLETKAIFFHLLSKFEIVPVEKTRIPIKLDRYNFNLNAEGGFWVGFKRRAPQF